MIRQYRITKKSHVDDSPTMLIPGLDGAEYNVPEIRDAVEFLRGQPKTRMVGMTLGAAVYCIFVIEEAKLQVNHFELES